MYPWQSGSDGREESQVVHLNPKSGRWVPDDTHRQRHVNAAIAYNVWQYYQATADWEFLAFYGAEMILEIARFWASLAEYNAERDRFEIRGVVGPDEFHTQYPGRDEPGLRNNAYTNVFASWVLDCAGRVLELLGEERGRELGEDLGLSDEEVARWKHVAENMFVPIREDGVIEQFEGYEQLREFDWDGYRQEHGDVQRLDRILEAEGDDVNRYKASKQADVLMLFYLFSAEELQARFARMGYDFRPEWIATNIDYYNHRTSHGSTLSRVVHSWVLARSDRERSWRLFEQALESDVADIQGGTASEGIHLGAMAGTVDLVQRCYTGIEMRDDVLWFNPCLPDPLNNVHFQLRYRSVWIAVELAVDTLRLTIDRNRNEPVKIGFQGEVHQPGQGDVLEFTLNRHC
jgi:alpha,alpha-trehalase